MKLDKSPFVIISVIGQELLAQAKYNAAVQVRIPQERITQNMLLFRNFSFKVAPFILNRPLLQQSRAATFYFEKFLSRFME
jgi:hypothetical protein